MGDCDYFSATQPLKKEQILEIFRDVLALTKLFVAPFGLLQDASDVLGEFVARKDFKSIHRCWEDFCARKVYSLKGVSDDSVAASLQYYLETKQDQEMNEAMKINEMASSSLLTPKKVVALPDDIPDMEELACAAFLAVASAWKHVEDDFSIGLLQKSKEETFRGRDLEVNTIHPCDIGYIVSFLSISTIERLMNCLSNIPYRSGIVALSYEQYEALLHVYFISVVGPVSPRIMELFKTLDSLLDESSSVRQSSLSEFYGGMIGGSTSFLRRLQALGWKQAFLYQDTAYLPRSDGGHSTYTKKLQGSPFSHPIVASVFYIEEIIRLNSDTDSESEKLNSHVSHLENVHETTMELLNIYNGVMKKRYGKYNGEMKSDQEIQEEEEGADENERENDQNGILDVMFTVEEAITLFEKKTEEISTSASLETNVTFSLEKLSICEQSMSSLSVSDLILSNFLLERAACRIKTEEVKGALDDINHALRIDPKSAAAYKNRFRIYSKLAILQNDDEHEEYDDAASDSSSENSLKSLLIKSAYDALAAFVLDGSTNVLLAGAAEDAAREACRNDAKEYFWERNDECSDNDEDGSNDDCSEDESDRVVSRKANCESGSFCSLLADSACSEKQESNLRLLDEIMISSTLPRSWLVNSYMTLFAPLNIALDIPLKIIENYTAHVDDGLDEEVSFPFQHLLDEIHANEDDGSVMESGLKEGDVDAFDLICQVTRNLLRCKSLSKKSPTAVQKNTESTSRIQESESNIVEISHEVVSGQDSIQESNTEEWEKIEIWDKASYSGLMSEIYETEIEAGTLSILDRGSFSVKHLDSEILTSRVDDEVPSKSPTENDILDRDVSPSSSDYFQDSFRALANFGACALTGVVFNWRRIGDDSKEKEASDTSPQFRLSVEVDESLVSLRKRTEILEDGDSVESKHLVLRDVSERLRARLLSLCGSVAYLCGDAMGGYECLKASILHDDNLLDSRLKISSILLEMDEIDKAEAQLTEAKHRPCWEEDICLNLHIAELHLHRMEYFPAVRILRTTSRRLDFLLQGWQGLAEEKETAEHIGPTIFSLHGVAEFRVTPDTPLKALNILQKGVESFPDNVSLCVCYGEVLGQAGDPAGSLKCYMDATTMEPNHPLPYLNASRVYQQLNQMQLCKMHMAKAFDLDRTLSLTLVDIAQFKLHEKRFLNQGELSSSSHTSNQLQSATTLFLDERSSEEILDTAVEVSRHVSEVIDVFTARKIASFYAKLGASGLAPVFL